MSETTTILIPDEAENSKLFTVLFEPRGANFKIDLTFDGEDKPFAKLKKLRSSNQASFFMRRKTTLDVKKKKFTEPLKAGDVVIVKCIHENKTVTEQRVTIK